MSFHQLEIFFERETTDLIFGAKYHCLLLPIVTCIMREIIDTISMKAISKVVEIFFYNYILKSYILLLKKIRCKTIANEASLNQRPND